MDKLKTMAEALGTGVKNQWDKGRPFREMMGAALTGNFSDVGNIAKDYAATVNPQDLNEGIMNAGMGFAPIGMAGVIKNYPGLHNLVDQGFDAGTLQKIASTNLTKKTRRDALQNLGIDYNNQKQLSNLAALKQAIQQVQEKRKLNNANPMTKSGGVADVLINGNDLQFMNITNRRLQEKGLLRDALDVYKNTPASIGQAQFSAYRIGENKAANVASQIAQQNKQKILDNYVNVPIADFWHKNLSNKVNDEINTAITLGATSPRDIIRNFPDIESAGRAATLEAIAREAKKRGMAINYVSAKSSHAGGSQYIESPDGKIIRISDHELPETPQRLFNRSQGLNGKWDKEIILDDWRTTSMDDYFKKILNTDE